MDYSSFSATQEDIDQQQAEIRAINLKQEELEARQQAAAAKPPLWRRLMERLRR
ncbi:MAG: hypothetical protein IJ176_05730 [Prevotella sp.]|nr:hypothetical protein [Prevotella sp.]